MNQGMLLEVCGIYLTIDIWYAGNKLNDPELDAVCEYIDTCFDYAYEKLGRRIPENKELGTFFRRCR